MKKKNEFHLHVLFKYIKQYKIQFIIAGIILFLSNLVLIVEGYLNGAVIEYVTKNNLQMVLICFASLFVLSMIDYLITNFCYFFLSKIQILVSRTMGFDLYKKVVKLPAYAFEELSTGEISNRISNDTEVIVGTVNTVLDLAMYFITVIILFVYIFYSSVLIGVEIILFLIFYAFVVKFYIKVFKAYDESLKAKNDKYSSLTNETVRGIREIKTLGISKTLIENTKDMILSLFDTSIKSEKTSRNYAIFTSTLRCILECFVMLTAAILTYYGKCSLTFFVSLTYYIYRFSNLLENIKYFSRTYQRLNVSLGRIGEILNNEKYEDVTYGEKTLEHPKGVIAFHNVTFGYKNEGIILKDFNIEIESKKKVAIVGSSGGGKSTLFNLITRIFDPLKGSITLDGVDIRDLTEESLRNNISIIRQDPFIFNRSIKDNFLLLDENLSLTEIRKYCKMASIDEYIMSLPKKYDTILGEGGVNLSGGQKQRIAIARTLLKKSKVILFDEATSALDNESQECIKESIEKLVKKHTVIIIAHRLSTIIDADIIYVIKDGKVLARGNHSQLLENCEYYKNLYKVEGDYYEKNACK